jgi:hypothetical protein
LLSYHGNDACSFPSSDCILFLFNHIQQVLHSSEFGFVRNFCERRNQPLCCDKYSVQIDVIANGLLQNDVQGDIPEEYSVSTEEEIQISSVAFIYLIPLNRSPCFRSRFSPGPPYLSLYMLIIKAHQRSAR